MLSHSPTSNRLPVRLLTILFGLSLLFSTLENNSVSRPVANTLEPQLQSQQSSKFPIPLDDPLSDSAKQNIAEITQTVSTVEWLGPLAPIALSPFFGITCLSGLSMFSQGTPWEGNAFISHNEFLQNPFVFWVFLVLTILTSLPRLTKVSKPLAQALDQVEAFSGIITLIILRVVAATAVPSAESEPLVYVAGIFSVTFDTLMVVAMIINVIVINTIKFFFEVMVWMIPFPFVDAILEGTNKLICAVLMVIYAFSPLLATIFNLIIFGICAIAFNWVYRRVTYARRILTDPLIALVFPGYGKIGKHLLVFSKQSFGPFPAKAKLRMTKTDRGWCLRRRRLFLRPVEFLVNSSEDQPELIEGLLVNQIRFKKVVTSPLIFSRRHNLHLEELAAEYGLKRSTAAETADTSTLEIGY